uniref:CD55 molecule (Cromer blood group) n=1 Tax=Molossus molossus TaxID=27622 RepID=A0A7J8CQ01_MOLMO|nr:CD55 molecule (Cromer blood group) [Molossus molossus]
MPYIYSSGLIAVASTFSTVLNKSESSPISKPTSTPQKPTTTDVPGTKPPSTPQKSTTVNVSATEGSSTPQKPTTTDVPATQGPAVAKTTTSVHSRSTSKGSGTISAGTSFIASGKFHSSAVKRNCLHCRIYNPCLWKRILSFNCFRNTIKMRCLWVPKRKQINVSYLHVMWTPLGTWYVPKYYQNRVLVPKKF